MNMLIQSSRPAEHNQTAAIASNNFLRNAASIAAETEISFVQRQENNAFAATFNT